jgi:hypothetical protein
MRAGADRADVARAFGVSPATVYGVAAEKTWRVDTQKIVNGRLVKLTPEELRIARSELFPEEALLPAPLANIQAREETERQALRDPIERGQ